MAQSLTFKGSYVPVVIICFLLGLVNAQSRKFDDYHRSSHYDLPDPDYYPQPDEEHYAEDYPVDYEELEESLDQEIEPRRYVIAVVYCVIAVTAIVMNVTAIAVAQRCAVLQYSQRIFMQNLCISCLVLVVTMIFSAQEKLLDDWKIGSVLCKLVNCLKALAIFSQAYFTVTVCADFVVLKKRPRISEITRTIMEIAAMSAGWIAALGYSSPLLVFADTRQVMGDRQQCILFALPKEKVDVAEEEEADYDDYFPARHEIFPAKVAAADDAELTCKEVSNPPFFAWIAASFVIAFALPALASLILYLLNKVLETPHVVLRTNTLPEQTPRSRKASRNRLRSRRCMSSGFWVTALSVAYFACWLPFYVYHLGRIPGLNLSSTSCTNLRDYSFLQGYLSCIFLPAIVISYSRPLDIQSCSRALTTSSTSSFASASSAASNRKSLSSSSQTNGDDDVLNVVYEVPLMEQESQTGQPTKTSSV